MKTLKSISKETIGLMLMCVIFFIVGRKVAVDASMCIYQFLIAVRQDGSNLMNEDGETTR